MSKLPQWLQPPPPTRPAPAVRQLDIYFEREPLPDCPYERRMEVMYRNLFDRTLTNLRQAISVAETLRDDLRDISYGSFLNWIHASPDREAAYQEARRVGALAMEDHAVAIADGIDPHTGQETMEDVTRSTLRINTRKFAMQAWNRDRYGEKRQIDQNVNIDIADAMKEADQRLRLHRGVTVDGEVVSDGD